MTPRWSTVKRRGVTMMAAATLLTTSSLGAGLAFADELGNGTNTISAPSIEATLTRSVDDTSVAKREREQRGGEGAGHAFAPTDAPAVLAKREREQRGGEGAGHAFAPTDAQTLLAKREREQRGGEGAGHA